MDRPAREAELLDPENSDDLDRLLDGLEGARVVYVGERHDRLDHHLNQLAVIQGLRERGVDLAIGMEFFQEPFQAHLDAYVAGEIGEQELLDRTEYYDRWRYDFRLYRPILAYARAEGIPLLALNAPTELVSRVSAGGLEGISEDDRARLPADLAEPDEAYLERLRPIFEMHGAISESGLRRFAEVQMLWDEHMARVARDYLVAQPRKILVVLAGSGHVTFPDAIPGRLARMVPSTDVVVATGEADWFAGGSVDYVLAERDMRLPPAGRVGVKLADSGAGGGVGEAMP